MVDEAALVHCDLWCDWFKRCLVFKPTWPPSPLHTYTSTRTLPSLSNFEAMKCTSHLRSKGISPQILPLNYWRGPCQLDSDYPPINMPRLSSYNIKYLTRSMQPIRGAIAARNAECIVLHCLYRHCLAYIIGVFMLVTDMITNWQRCSWVFLLSGMAHR